jgi:flagellar hook-associated protein 3 FlgL
MRITNKSVYYTYLGQLENIQNNKYKEEVRLNTGKQINSIEEAPERLAEVKLLESKIKKNEGFQNNLQDTLSEMRIVSESMDFISNTLSNLRQTAIDSTQTSATTSPQTYASQIKNYLEDIVSQANTEFNGRTLYSGTATTTNSVKIDPAGPLGAYSALSTNESPFELIVTTATAENPSGLKVIFKGNNNDRIINKDQNSTEIINVKSQDLFGTGTEPKLFQDIIKIYNTVKFNLDGSLRTEDNNIVGEGLTKIEELQKTLLDHDQKITNTSALFGSKYNRLESLSEQLSNENIRLKEITSIKSDTDVAKTTIALKLEETALQYSLQIGSRIMQNSLFDFLR